MRLFLRGRARWWIISTCLALLVGALAVTWLGQTRLLAWYYVYRLSHASPENQAFWVERATKLEGEIIPPLLYELTLEDANACAGSEAALFQLGKLWGTRDSRNVDLASLLADRFADFSSLGQRAVLDLTAGWLRLQPAVVSANPTSQVCCRLVSEAARASDQDVHAKALDLAPKLLGRAATAQDLHACREITRACLRDDSPVNRIGAIRLASHPAVSLLQPASELLSDPAPEVRRAAMSAVGGAAEAISKDDLLRCLHDPDAEVRQLCETALRGRGLRDDQLKLGKLLTDERAGTRLEVLEYLRYHSELEPGVWLRRLSKDPSPAVRAAAIRAAADRRLTSLTDRMEQMAQNDPSPTVRQMAQFYLSYRKRQNP